MDKRLLYAMVLSVGIMVLWTNLFPSKPTPAPLGSAAMSAVSTGAGTGVVGSNTPTAEAPKPALDFPAERTLEERVSMETDDATYVFSTWGASLREIHLKDKQFLLKKGNVSEAKQMVTTTGENLAPLRMTFAKAGFAFSESLPWTVLRPMPSQVIFRAETSDVVLEKRYTLQPLRHRLRMDISIQNKTEKSQEHALVLQLAAKQDPEKKSGGFFDYASANLAEAVCHVNDKAQRAVVEALVKEPKNLVGGIRWFAAGDKYFTIAVVPYAENPGKDRGCIANAVDGDKAIVALSFSTRLLQPAQKTEYAFEVYAGPKYISDLDAVRPDGQDARLAEAVDVTFAALSRPMLGLLKQFFRLTGNWGVAIILLTIFVRCITFYPTHRTLVSAKKMQGLSGKIAALREKYGNDKQRLGTETMNLYKAHGVSPFGGCLPSLIQMPIWIALFSTLNYSVELYHSAFFGYITDLSAKDPYYLAPLLMGAVMFFQMRMSPAGTDPQQQKMMAIMMPIMFTGFSLFLPAGLSIYTLTSYLIGILQQLFVNWRFKQKVAI